MADGRVPKPGATPLLRLLVAALAVGELAFAGYLLWALFVDDTTSWIVTLIPDLEEVWRPMVLPSALAGGIALMCVFLDRWLWPALLIVLAAPLVSLWMLA